MSYASIITAIDTAIESGVSGPGSITSADGESISYRSLDELLKTRSYYQELLNASGDTVSFKIQKIKGGSVRYG